MDHNELRELTGAYALGILTDDERLALEGHLRDCQSCADEVRESIKATSALAVGVQQIDPPASLRARVLAAATQGSAERAPLTSKPRSSYSALPYWLSAAAALAAIALGLYAMNLRTRVQDLEAQLRVATAATDTMQKQLISLSADADEAQRRLHDSVGARRPSNQPGRRATCRLRVGECVLEPDSGIVPLRHQPARTAGRPRLSAVDGHAGTGRARHRAADA